MNAFRYLLLATVMGSAAAASAQTVPDSEIKVCAAKSNTVTRIACYDALANKYKMTTESNTTTKKAVSSNWTVSDSTNPLDDSRTVVISTTAKTGKSSWGDRVTLIARCQSNETELYINWNDYLGNDSTSVYSEYKNVTTRIGSFKAEQTRWGLSTDSKATFAPGWGGDWIKKIAAADEFVAQTTPYNESPITAVFDVSGLRDAAEPLASTCGWNFD